MANGKPISNDKLYDLVDRTRLELKGDIIRLETKFDTLEAGRLTRAEADISKLQVKDATLNTKVYFLVFIISSVMSGLITVAVSRLIK